MDKFVVLASAFLLAINLAMRAAAEAPRTAQQPGRATASAVDTDSKRDHAGGVVPHRTLPAPARPDLTRAP